MRPGRAGPQYSLGLGEDVALDDVRQRGGVAREVGAVHAQRRSARVIAQQRDLSHRDVIPHDCRKHQFSVVNTKTLLNLKIATRQILTGYAGVGETEYVRGVTEVARTAGLQDMVGGGLAGD